ncbi:SRPBCC family protein [Pedobacter ureilyticus]|uniref:SRPBCC family protein n=1 Tax=Pedobacter ureilyticus TaxID=1393051 RepID=A0ABW9JBD1_9SPHI|nr:SRPBCC family protein [Pedobacter helvus]
MTKKIIPSVETQMLIRKSASEVFNAFIDPAITTNFWFTKSSGKLEVGKKVNWQWEMYGASADVLVKEIIPNQKIIAEWGEPATIIDFAFEAIDENSTYVVIKNYGFLQTGDDLIAVIKDSTGGFTTVLDGVKAYLEHGIKLNLIGDKFLKK